jgi:hypothetical protein
LNLWLVDELLLCASARVDDGRQEGIRAMRHMESESLDMATYPRQRFETRGFGKGRCLEGHGHFLKETGRSFRREVMAHEAEVGQVLEFHMVQYVVAAGIV